MRPATQINGYLTYLVGASVRLGNSSTCHANLLQLSIRCFGCQKPLSNVHTISDCVLAAGIPNQLARVAVRSQDGRINWLDSLVLDYASSADQYLVQVQSGSAQQGKEDPQTVSAPCGAEPPDAGSNTANTPFWVPRVQLCFAAEDPALYAQRFAAACAALDAVEVQLAYELCIDGMPLDDVPQMTTEQVNRVLNFALNSKRLKDKLMDTSTLINEANLEHARAMNKATLQALVIAGKSATLDGRGSSPAAQFYAAAAAGAVADVQMMSIVAPPAVDSQQAPLRATAVMPDEYNFKEVLSEFSFKTLLTKTEVIHALGKIRMESSKVRSCLCCCAWLSCSDVAAL